MSVVNKPFASVALPIKDKIRFIVIEFMPLPDNETARLVIIDKSEDPNARIRTGDFLLIDWLPIKGMPKKPETLLIIKKVADGWMQTCHMDIKADKSMDLLVRFANYKHLLLQIQFFEDHKQILNNHLNLN